MKPYTAQEISSGMFAATVKTTDEYVLREDAMKRIGERDALLQKLLTSELVSRAMNTELRNEVKALLKGESK